MDDTSLPEKKKWSHTLINVAFFCVRKILGPLVRLLFVKKVEGIENIPKKGPVIVAFNHESYFDFICFIAVSPRNIHYLAAEKFFKNPFWRPIMHATGQIHVDRRSKDKRVVHNVVLDHLKDGGMIGIFPEGTRAPTKEEMLKAFTGVAKYAIKARVPVVPVGIQGTYDILSRHDKKLKIKKIVTIHIGEPMYFNTYFDRAKLNQKSFEVLTEKIMIKISKLSGKPYPHVRREYSWLWNKN